MTEEQKKAKIRLIELGKSQRDLCKATGLKDAAISSTLRGRTSARRTRQAIANFLGAELWGLRPTERYLHVPSSAGMEIEFLNAKRARDAAAELPPDVVTRRGKTIRFVKDITIVAPVHQSRRTASERNREISSTSTELKLFFQRNLSGATPVEMRPTNTKIQNN